MQTSSSDIEARLDRLVHLYGRLDEVIDQVPVALPRALHEQIKKALYGNQDMADVVDGIKHRRPPRFILVGRTGIGESSLINALAGRYLAKVSDVTLGTTAAHPFAYTSLGKTLFEVIDTRGLGESVTSSTGLTAIDTFVTRCRPSSPTPSSFCIAAKNAPTWTRRRCWSRTSPLPWTRRCPLSHC
jgi:hypothetical protein